VVGPAAGVDQALASLDDQEPDIALLDINLGGRPVTPVAAACSGRGVPFALLTADPRLAVGERELAEAPILEKPTLKSSGSSCSSLSRELVEGIPHGASSRS
jgi:DNA-binding LytR/AlgR family response regulator